MINLMLDAIKTDLALVLLLAGGPAILLLAFLISHDPTR